MCHSPTVWSKKRVKSKQGSVFLLCWRSLECHQKCWRCICACFSPQFCGGNWQKLCWFWSRITQIYCCRQNYKGPRSFFSSFLKKKTRSKVDIGLQRCGKPEIGCNSLIFIFKFCPCWIVQTSCKLDLTCSSAKKKRKWVLKCFASITSQLSILPQYNVIRSYSHDYFSFRTVKCTYSLFIFCRSCVSTISYRLVNAFIMDTTWITFSIYYSIHVVL